MTTTMNQEQIEQLVQDWKREWCRIPHDQPLEALEIYIAKKTMELFKGRRLVQDAAPIEAVQAGPVAWRYKSHSEGTWYYTQHFEQVIAALPATYIHEPLYLHPAPPDAVPVADVVSVPREVVEKFTGLLQDHNNRGDDDRPVFGINNVTITLGDLRALQSALEASK